MGAPLERRSGGGRGGKGGGTTLLLRLLLGLTTAAAGPRGAWGCDCSTQTLCDQCAFGSVLSIMSARQQDIAIQTHGCTAIGNAVSSRIGDLDGSVEAVIGAMKAFPGDLSSYKQLAAIPESSKLKTLQQSCCETLVALAGAGGLHVKIQQANGAAVITSAMLAFPDELPLQRTAVLTLGNLIQNQPIASATVESVGGMHATLAAMVAFPTDLHLQQHGCFTLAGLAERDQERQDAIAAADGISAVLSAMEHHAGRWMVQEFCCYALNSLMAAPEHEKNAAAAVAAGGVELVATARKKHTNARRCVDTAKHLSAAAAKQDL